HAEIIEGLVRKEHRFIVAREEFEPGGEDCQPERRRRSVQALALRPLRAVEEKTEGFVPGKTRLRAAVKGRVLDNRSEPLALPDENACRIKGNLAFPGVRFNSADDRPAAVQAFYLHFCFFEWTHRRAAQTKEGRVPSLMPGRFIPWCAPEDYAGFPR